MFDRVSYHSIVVPSSSNIIADLLRWSYFLFKFHVDKTIPWMNRLYYFTLLHPYHSAINYIKETGRSRGFGFVTYVDPVSIRWSTFGRTRSYLTNYYYYYYYMKYSPISDALIFG
jgi:hypothetical protein